MGKCFEDGKMPIKRGLASLGMVFGFLGVAGCLAATLVVLSFGTRLLRTNDRAFALVDRTLASAHDRVLSAQRRVQESRITAEDIGQNIRQWATLEIPRKIASRLQVERKSEKLTLTLQQTCVWLETSAALIQTAQETLNWRDPSGNSADAPSEEPVAGQLVELLERLQQAVDSVDKIREIATASLREEPSEDRIARAIQMAARITATFTEVDARLGETADRLSEWQAQLKPQQIRIHNYIVIGVILAILFLTWLAAGQTALCVYGWKNLR
jgi:chromosome segregation ATPase